MRAPRREAAVLAVLAALVAVTALRAPNFLDADNLRPLSRQAALLAAETGRAPQVTFQSWRPNDQKVYISDIRKIAHALGWRPTVNAHDGVRRVLAWVTAHQALF